MPGASGTSASKWPSASTSVFTPFTATTAPGSASPRRVTLIARVTFSSGHTTLSSTDRGTASGNGAELPTTRAPWPAASTASPPLAVSFTSPASATTATRPLPSLNTANEPVVASATALLPEDSMATAVPPGVAPMRPRSSRNLARFASSWRTDTSVRSRTSIVPSCPTFKVAAPPIPVRTESWNPRERGSSAGPQAPPELRRTCTSPCATDSSTATGPAIGTYAGVDADAGATGFGAGGAHQPQPVRRRSAARAANALRRLMRARAPARWEAVR